MYVMLEKKLSQFLSEEEISRIIDIGDYLTSNIEVAKKLFLLLDLKYFESREEINSKYDVIFDELEDYLQSLLLQNKVLLIRNKATKKITLLLTSIETNIQELELSYDYIAYTSSKKIKSNANIAMSSASKRVFTDDEALDLLEEILKDAVVKNIGDVYIRPFLSNKSKNSLKADSYEISFEKNDMKHHYKTIEAVVANALIGVIGVKAGMSVSSNTPIIDGKMEMKINYVIKEFRVNLIRSLHNGLADLTIRVGGFFDTTKKIEDLGFCKSVIDVIRDNYLKKKLFILSAPTGNGKTTAILTILLEIAIKHSKKVSTLEDPIEYQLSNYFSQLQINYDGKGSNYVDYEKGIKAQLRAKPHVLFVGEIRDEKSAIGAINASRTGHTTFTTLHTSRTKLVPSRLSGFGVSENEIIENLGTSICMALEPKLCIDCRKYDMASGYYKANDKDDYICHACGGAGYYGKVILNDVAVYNNEIESLKDENLYKTRITYDETIQEHLEKGNISFEDATKYRNHYES